MPGPVPAWNPDTGANVTGYHPNHLIYATNLDLLPYAPHACIPGLEYSVPLADAIVMELPHYVQTFEIITDMFNGNFVVKRLLDSYTNP